MSRCRNFESARGARYPDESRICRRLAPMTKSVARDHQKSGGVLRKAYCENHFEWVDSLVDRPKKFVVA